MRVRELIEQLQQIDDNGGGDMWVKTDDPANVDAVVRMFGHVIDLPHNDVVVVWA